MYSTYDLYQENGGTLDQSSYLILAKKAAYILDHETMGRARDAPASMAEAFSSTNMSHRYVLLWYRIPNEISHPGCSLL